MRIRKNLKLLNLPPYPLDAINNNTEATPTLCKLNQSPWDVDAPHFVSPNSSSFPQLGEDEFNLYGDVKIGGSIDAKQSNEFANVAIATKAARAAAPNSDNGDAKEQDRTKNDDDDGGSASAKAKKEDNVVVARKQSKGKSSEKAPESSSSNSSNGVVLAKRRGRGPSKKTSTNPYDDIYYYSGFGPMWGKKRGERRSIRENARENNASGDSGGGSGGVSEIAQTTERFVIDFEDMDEDDEDNGKKRARKPMKARSLKSIM